MACRWRIELAGVGADEEVNGRAEQTASRGQTDSHPAPSGGMADNAGRSPRQTAGGVNDERHPAGFPSRIPRRRG